MCWFYQLTIDCVKLIVAAWLVDCCLRDARVVGSTDADGVDVHSVGAANNDIAVGLYNSLAGVFC